MKTKKTKKQLKSINNLTRGRKMKYFSIILTVMLTALFGRATEPQTGWFFDQSTQQSFYLFDDITIDGLVVEGDGTGEADGECYTSGTCDVVGAFRQGVCDDPGYQNSQQLCEIFSVWNTDEEICIGWRYADSNGATTVPLMGKEGAEGDNTFIYANPGESAYLKIYDSSNGSILDLNPSAELPGWSLNDIFTIAGTSTANNTFGCTDATACNFDAGATADDGSCWSANDGCSCADGNGSEVDCAGVCNGSSALDDCGVCDGGNASMDCAGDCGGSSTTDNCGVCDDDTSNDDASCTGCTNADGDNYDSGNTIDDGSCSFTVSPATNLSAEGGPARVYLSWDAAVDNFTQSSAGFTYDVYLDGEVVKSTNQSTTQITGLESGIYCFTVQAIHNEYGASADLSNEACAEPLEVVGPTWRLQVKAEIDSYDQFEFSGNEDWLLRDDENYLGAAADGSWGYDPNHDAPDPPQGPGNYIKLFFDHPEWVDGSEGSSWVTHFTEDIVLDDDDFFSTNLTQWNIRVQSDVPGSTVIRFNVETGQVPSNYEMYVELDGNYTRIEHDGETAIEFYMDGSGQQDLAVYIGNIAPQSPDNLNATGNYASVSLDWDEDGTDLNDIGNRYPATSYNVYRDDEPADPNSNDGNAGDGPGGCGGLLTGGTGQSNSDYEDDADIYPAFPGEGLLQESTYSYTVTGTNDAGESSEGHTVRLSGGANTFHDGRDSRATTTTGVNADPVSVPVYMESPNGTNVDWESGIYEIPHNNNIDANRIVIREGAWGSYDPDFPYDDLYNFEYLWTQTAGPEDLTDIVGTGTPELSFSVANAHIDADGNHNGDKSYTWNLHAESLHPVKVSGECGVWTTEMHAHSDDQELTVTIQPEPNQNPTAADGRDLIRGGDGLSVITSNDYDNPSQGGSNDYNDFDSAEGVWYEPHNNSGDDNQADLWFTAYNSDDADGMCDVGGPPTCAWDCPGFFDIMDADGEPLEGVSWDDLCQWVVDTASGGSCLDDCDANMMSNIDEFAAVCDECLGAGDCSGIDGCPDGYVEDCTGDGDCAPEGYVGDGWCDGEDEPYGVDLTCYEDDGGDCAEGANSCPNGYVEDCADIDCCPASWVGDGFADCEDQADGCDLTCYDNDGGDCEDDGFAGGESSEACTDCEFDWSNYGSECCDTAWDEFGIDCADLEANYNWDCSGCACLGDTDEPSEGCNENQFDCGDGQCIPASYFCDGSDEFCNASWPADCANGADEGINTCGYADECGSEPEGCAEGTVEDCSGDGDCCAESWIGDGYEDCEDQAYGCDLTCYDNDGGDCLPGRSYSSTPKHMKGSVALEDMINRRIAATEGGFSAHERRDVIESDRSSANFCDEQTYEWYAATAGSAGFNYIDANNNGIFDIGESFTLINNNAIVQEFSPEEFWDDNDNGVWDSESEAYIDANNNGYYDIGTDLGSYLPPQMAQYDECANCIDGQYTSSDDSEDVGYYGHGGMDLHGEFDNNIYILTLKVTDIYLDSDYRSLLFIVNDERNDGPTADEHRSQPTSGDAYYVRYDEDVRDVQVTDGCDNLGADDSDNDDLTFDWSYDGPDGISLDGFDSDYSHANATDPNGWVDASADLGVGTHTFTFTVTDSYGESSSSSTTFEIREEPDAVPATVVVDSTDLKYAIISVTDNALADFSNDDCYGEVYNGTDYNTRRIDLFNGEVLIKSWEDTDDVQTDHAPWIDKYLEAETSYDYTAIAYNSNQLDAESASSSTSTTTHDRPQISVLTPNGAEIRSITDNFDVDFSTTQKEYISKIEVYYLRDGETLEAGVNSSGASVGSNTGVHVDGDAPGDDTENFEISDNTGTEVNYNAKVLVRVYDVGNYDGGNVQYHEDISDFPFTMSAHTISREFSSGWHLVGPPVTPWDDVLVDNFSLSFGQWGSEWVAYNSNGTYDNLTLNLGEGYYLALASPKTLYQSGDPVIADPDCADCLDNSFALADLDLDKGWNLVANPLVNKVSKETFTVCEADTSGECSSDDLPFDDAVDAGWIAPTIYGWFENSYSAVDRLMPFSGYFINTSRALNVKVRPHLYEDGELTRKSENVVTSVLELKARDISGEGSSDLITVGLSETADDKFVYGEDEYDLPRNAYTSMGGEFIDMKVGSDLMKDIKSSEYDDFQAWTISIESEKVDNDIELSWGDVSGFEDDLHIVINGEAINMHEENFIELTSMIEEVAIVVGNVDSYLNPIPDEFGLSAAYPNPFNPTTNLGLALNADGFVSMSVFNIRGQVVEVLVDRNMKAGYHNITWNADGISSGMYFVRVETGANIAMQKLMLLK